MTLFKPSQEEILKRVDSTCIQELKKDLKHPLQKAAFDLVLSMAYTQGAVDVLKHIEEKPDA